LADNQGKHSLPRAQGSRRRAHASTQPASPVISKTAAPAKKPMRRRRKRRPLPLLPPPVVTRRGKTTISRYSNRSFHRMEEIKGKTVDYVEFFTSGDVHSIDVRFQDKTSLHFTIDPGFTLEREYADWKTGNWQPIKQWPLLRSQAR
jgi:hypothetical protein